MLPRTDPSAFRAPARSDDDGASSATLPGGAATTARSGHAAATPAAATSGSRGAAATARVRMRRGHRRPELTGWPAVCGCGTSGPAGADGHVRRARFLAANLTLARANGPVAVARRRWSLPPRADRAKPITHKGECGRPRWWPRGPIRPDERATAGCLPVRPTSAWPAWLGGFPSTRWLEPAAGALPTLSLSTLPRRRATPRPRRLRMSSRPVPAV